MREDEIWKDVLGYEDAISFMVKSFDNVNSDFINYIN